MSKKITKIISMLIILLFHCLTNLFSLEILSEHDISEFSIYNDSYIKGDLLYTFSGAISQNIEEKKNQTGSLIKIENCSYNNSFNCPIIPQHNIKISLEGDYEVENVILSSGNLRKGRTENKISICIPHEKLLHCESYDINQYYPNKWITYTSGFDGKNTYLFIHLYPFQWKQTSSEAIVLSDFEVKIYGEKRFSNNLKSKFLRTEASHILLAPSEWEETVISMAEFHENQGINSEVVFIDSIYSSYESAELPDYYVYDDFEFEKSGKLISYLRDFDAHPNLEYVTILGSAEHIPPSYYLNFFEDRSPTDQFYSSPDYDWVDNFSLTRIPVHTEEDLIIYLRKMMAWSNETSTEWTNRAVLTGGRFFSFYEGEHYNNQFMCGDLFNNIEVTKYTETDGNFTATNLLSSLRNDDFLFYTQMNHGYQQGTEMSLFPADNSSYTSDDILALPDKSRLPIFITAACNAGFWDSYYLQSVDNCMAISEALMASYGGAIAFLGSARETWAFVPYVSENGNIVYTGQSGVIAMFYRFFESYRESDNPVFGHLIRDAKLKFLEDIDLISEPSMDAYIRFTAHGSSCLQLPVAPSMGEPSEIATISLEGSETYENSIRVRLITNDENPPVFTLSDDNSYDLIIINEENNHVTGGYTDITQVYELEELHGRKNLINKLVNDEGKEAWFYCSIDKWGKYMDGNQDDWFEDEIIGNDSVGEITPYIYDLEDFYAYYHSDYDEVYFGLPVNINSDLLEPDERLYYIIAIDDEPWGINSTYGENSQFPYEIYVNFDNAIINKFIAVICYKQTAESDLIFCTNSYEIDENGNWNYITNLLPFFSLNTTDNFLELLIFGTDLNIDNGKACVFSSTEMGIAEDIIPGSQECPSEVLYGEENANIISDYIPLRNMHNYVGNTEDLTENPTSISLLSNYPNPFAGGGVRNIQTKISFVLSKEQKVNLSIFNIRGQKILTLADNTLDKGIHYIYWDGRDEIGKKVSSGVYLYRLKTNEESVSKKMLLLK